MLRDRGTCPSITKTHSSAATGLGYHEARCKRATVVGYRRRTAPWRLMKRAPAASSETLPLSSVHPRRVSFSVCGR